MSKQVTAKQLGEEIGMGTEYTSKILCRWDFEKYRLHSHYHVFKDCKGFRTLWNKTLASKVITGRRIAKDENTSRNAAGMSGCICCGVYLGDFVQSAFTFPETV
jgi:hypothetical protein